MLGKKWEIDELSLNVGYEFLLDSSYKQKEAILRVTTTIQGNLVSRILYFKYIEGVVKEHSSFEELQCACLCDCWKFQFEIHPTGKRSARSFQRYVI